MVNVPHTWGPVGYKDIDSINYWNEMIKRFPNDRSMLDKALKALRNGGRDNARTAMQWNASENAGFTTGTPWIRAHDNCREINVEAAQKDPSSIQCLPFLAEMLKFRKQHSDVFIEGGFEIYDQANPDIFTFVKTVRGEPHAAVVLNFSDKEQKDPILQNLKHKKLVLLLRMVMGKGICLELGRELCTSYHLIIGAQKNQ